MRLITIKQEVYDEYKKIDSEILDKEGRPCVLILRLTFKGSKRNFAIPLRSNITKNAPKATYFRLPTRKVTKGNYRHGLHYIKMMPIDSKYYARYILYNSEIKLVNAYLNKNEKIIIKECQKYLDDYEKGKKYSFCTNIEKLIEKLNELNKQK